MNLRARSFASVNPSATRLISQIWAISGTTIAQGLKSKALKSVSTSSVSLCSKWPEQGFQVLWQFSSSSVTRIHGNEYSNTRTKFDIIPQKHEVSFFGLQGVLNHFHLKIPNDLERVNSNNYIDHRGAVPKLTAAQMFKRVNNEYFLVIVTR